MDMWKRNTSGRGNSKYKDPEVGAYMVCSSNSEEWIREKDNRRQRKVVGGGKIMYGFFRSL